jgi:regulator of PEP synthase PpsR (kinase-PPPase family)
LRYPYIETFKDIDEVIQVAIDKNAIIVYTLVEPEIKVISTAFKEKSSTFFFIYALISGSTNVYTIIVYEEKSRRFLFKSC